MTEQEAIKVLKMVETHGALTTNAKDMAIKALQEMAKIKEMGDCYIIPKNGVWEVNGIDVHKALEKQIAKKPIEKTDSCAYFCPCCNGYIRSTYTRKEIILEEDVFCGRCGQKLDWQALAEMQKG